MATLFNAAAWLVDRHVEQGRGGRIAVRGTRTLTYAELSELSGDVAASLRRLGLRRDHGVARILADSGARVVCAPHECVEAVAAAIALAPEVEHLVLHLRGE